MLRFMLWRGHSGIWAKDEFEREKAEAAGSEEAVRQSRKGFMQSVIMEIKGGDALKKTSGRQTRQDLVIIWIYGVKKEKIRGYPRWRLPWLQMQIRKKEWVWGREQTLFCSSHAVFWKALWDSSEDTPRWWLVVRMQNWGKASDRRQKCVNYSPTGVLKAMRQVTWSKCVMEDRRRPSEDRLGKATAGAESKLRAAHAKQRGGTDS